MSQVELPEREPRPDRDRVEDSWGLVPYVVDDAHRRTHMAEQWEALRELRDSHEYQAFLLGASEVVAQGGTYVETLERLADVAVPMLADLRLVDTLTWEGRIERTAARHTDPSKQSLVEELGSNYPPDPAGVHPSIEVMRTGRARWSETMTDEFLQRTSRDSRHFELLKLLGFTSYMCLPLVAGNRILGSITLVSAGSGRHFGPKELALADEFTSCVAQVVATAQRNDAAREAARTLQASLLPGHLPDVAGLEFAVQYLPATFHNDVGGDFYDVIGARDGTAIIAIGDVAGHDIEAAAIMGKVRTAIRVLVSQATGPSHFIEMLHSGWDDLEIDRLVTLLIARVDVASGELTMASAGHPPPVLIDACGARFLDVQPSAPLGAPKSEIHHWRGSLERDAALFLFTDGLVEDRYQSFDEGAAKLLTVASKHRSPKELCDRVIETMVLDGKYHDDDIAMVALTRTAIS